ncbi:MAG: tetraacyldisaccharide 4'-kinase [Acidobacteriota bacterium]
MTVLLKPLELLWRGINRARRALYRAGILEAKRLPRPVISVGSIAAGGAGKTPATIAIARFLMARGYKVAVLTRGYGRAGAGGRVEAFDAAKYGDEPVLIRKATGVEVIVGDNRYRNGLSVNCDVFILDDGFQHLQLARDVDVVIDAPCKWYREGRSALRHADFVIPRRLAVRCDAVRGKRIFAFAGLADNEQFFEALRACGATLVGTRGFPDHHRYTAADLAAIRNAEADLIVTTEKDAVKIDDRDIIAVPAEMEIAPDVLEAIEARIKR